jgi:cholesterol oxidase
MNYLPDAVKHGCQIFCTIKVLYVEKDGKKWILNCLKVYEDREIPFKISCDYLILSAGTLGSTEILLRSKEKGLKMSDMVGKKFCGNGDNIAVMYNSEKFVNSVGVVSSDEKSNVGPIISSCIEVKPNDRPLNENYLIEEGGPPVFLYYFITSGLNLLSKAFGRSIEVDYQTILNRAGRELSSIVMGPYSGATNHSLLLLIMGFEDNLGRLILKNNKLLIDWKNAKENACYKNIDKTTFELTKEDKAILIPNPLFSDINGKQLITIHPLGN